MDKSDEILAIIGEIRTECAVIKNDMAYLKDGVKDRTVRLEKTEVRVGALEKYNSVMRGAIGVIVTGAGSAWILLRTFGGSA